ncbi:MAG: hypothetical protein NTU91_13205 [Chloroflexi bacterium]|nr:hypothetical protein [Chloroflexota bacterium]
MENMRVRLAAGVLLVAAGVLVLLQNLNIIRGGLSLLWSLCFLAGGAIFTYLYFKDRAHWWTIIPGFTLLGIGGLILLTLALPRIGDTLGTTLLLSAMGASFFVIYANRREQWWPIIPGGVLITVAISTLLEDLLRPAFDTGSLILIGLGVTFLLVYLLSPSTKRMTWALWPAGILAAIGLFIGISTSPLMAYVGPLALLAVGIYLVYRAVSSRPKAGS